MNKLQQVAEGLAIFNKYGEAANPSVAAEHDMFYAGVDGTLSEGDKLKLVELGWNDTPDGWFIWV